MHALDKARYEAAAAARTDMRSNGLHSSTVAGDRQRNLRQAGLQHMLRFRNGYFQETGTHFAARAPPGWPVCRGLH
jgi:hypothetical protein